METTLDRYVQCKRTYNDSADALARIISPKITDHDGVQDVVRLCRRIIAPNQDSRDVMLASLLLIYCPKSLLERNTRVKKGVARDISKALCITTSQLSRWISETKVRYIASKSIREQADAITSQILSQKSSR